MICNYNFTIGGFDLTLQIFLFHLFFFTPLDSIFFLQNDFVEENFLFKMVLLLCFVGNSFRILLYGELTNVATKMIE